MKPMLARPYSEKLIKFPGIVQPKLNGLRAVWEFDADGLFSRDQHKWEDKVLPNIYSSLRSEPTKEILKFIRGGLGKYKFLGLDGEIYCHSMSLQKINSRGSVNRITPHKEHYMLSFQVFDIISDAPMLERMEAMKMLELVEIPNVTAVPSHWCGNETTFNELYDLYYRQENYEGIMWRDPKAPYGMAYKCSNKENRWDCLVKRKPRLDMNVMIEGFNEGEGKHSGMLGAVRAITSHGVRFSVGSGLDDVTRKVFWEMGEERFKGHDMRIEFEMLSDDLVPLKPTISCINTPIDL